MKKVILACTIVAFSVGAMAQTDTTRRTNTNTERSKTEKTQKDPVTGKNRTGDQTNTGTNSQGTNKTQGTNKNQGTQKNDPNNQANQPQGTQKTPSRENTGSTNNSPGQTNQGSQNNSGTLGQQPPKGDSMNTGQGGQDLLNTQCAITLENGKVIVIKDGLRSTMSVDSTLTDGSMVMSNGFVKLKDGTTMQMKEGDCMDMNGRMIPVGNTTGSKGGTNNQRNK